MCPFGDIKDVSDSSNGKSGFFIVGSSCATCPLSKTVLHLSVACPSAELQSVMHHPTNQPMPGKDSATQALLSWKLSLSWAINIQITLQNIYTQTPCPSHVYNTHTSSQGIVCWRNKCNNKTFFVNQYFHALDSLKHLNQVIIVKMNQMTLKYLLTGLNQMIHHIILCH